MKEKLQTVQVSGATYKHILRYLKLLTKQYGVQVTRGEAVAHAVSAALDRSTKK